MKASPARGANSASHCLSMENELMSKIMVVDDTPEISILARAILEKEGYTVVKADSGKECLKKLKKEKTGPDTS